MRASVSLSRPNRHPGPAALRQLRLFAGAADEPRARRAGDVMLLVASALTLMVVTAVGDPPSRLEAALARMLAALPPFLDSVWTVFVKIPWVSAGALLLAVLARRRWALGRDLALAALVTAGLGWIITRVAPDFMGDPYPALPIAVSGAVLVTGHPHLIRALRRPVTLSVVGGVVGAVASLQVTPSGGLVIAMGAVASGALVHLVLGSARGRPLLEDVARAMAELGVDAQVIGIADRQEAGEFKMDGVDSTGAPLLIKVFGRDAHDTKLLRTAWRAAWYRGESPTSSLGRLGQVEHEGLVTLLASQAGVPTYSVLTAGASQSGDAFLVVRSDGSPLPPEWDAPLMAAMWATLGRLHSSGLTHGEIQASNMFIAGSSNLGLADFRVGAVTTSAVRRRHDQAQLFVATALAGAEAEAIDAAVAALGTDGFLETLPLVQAPVLTSTQRRAAKRAGLDLDELRERSAGAVGSEAPELQKLRRATWGTIAQTGLLVFAFLALSRVAGGIDFNELGAILADADWLVITAAILVGQVPTLARTVSALGASPRRVPFGPLYALQVATAYISLVIPSAAGRIALNVRFFQRQGLARTTALTVGAIDGFAGFVTQVTVLVLLLTLTPATLDLDFELSTSSGVGRLISWIVGIAVAGGLVVLAIRPIRERIVNQIRTVWAEASHALVGLASGRRLSLLIGGNFGVDLFNALSLGLFVLAFGYSLGLGELLVIGISVMLLAGLMPVPGGIGVTEGALVFGLVSAGLPDEVAFAAMVLFRMATFYIPPVWGFFTMRWLQRNDYI